MLNTPDLLSSPRGISVSNYCLLWYKFVYAQLYHSSQRFNSTKVIVETKKNRSAVGVLLISQWLRLFQMPLWGMLVSSTYGIVALTFERFLAVVYPIWHKTKFNKNKERSTRYTSCFSPACWNIGLVVIGIRVPRIGSIVIMYYFLILFN